VTPSPTTRQIKEVLLRGYPDRLKPAVHELLMDFRRRGLLVAAGPWPASEKFARVEALRAALLADLVELLDQVQRRHERGAS
jgi:hypothetical protein